MTKLTLEDVPPHGASAAHQAGTFVFADIAGYTSLPHQRFGRSVASAVQGFRFEADF